MVSWAAILARFIPVAVTEWVKIRYLYIVASTKHRLYGPDRTTSGFLLLSPEIRLRIWEELTLRDRCAREDTRVLVEVYPVWIDDFGIGDAIRYVLRFRRRNQTWLRPRIPLALLKTCRRNYEEGCHFWYTTSTFSFDDPRALHEFVNARPLSQQGIIRHLELHADSSWYTPSEQRDEDSGPELRDFNLRASQVLSITEKLQNLRTLDITIDYPNDADDVDYYTHSIDKLLRFVTACEAVTVTLDFCDWRSRDSYRIVRWEWDSRCQAQFAIAACTLIRDPNGYVRSTAPTEQVGQSKYVLEAQILV